MENNLVVSDVKKEEIEHKAKVNKSAIKSIFKDSVYTTDIEGELVDSVELPWYKQQYFGLSLPRMGRNLFGKREKEVPFYGNEECRMIRPNESVDVMINRIELNIERDLLNDSIFKFAIKISFLAALLGSTISVGIAYTPVLYHSVIDKVNTIYMGDTEKTLSDYRQKKQSELLEKVRETK